MNDPRPVIVVPRSAHVPSMIEPEPLSITPRAQRVGIVLIAPRAITPAELMVASRFWPKALASVQVRRIAVVLGVEAWVAARGILGACQFKMREAGIEIEFFHEAQLESDQIKAWFEQRKPSRRVSTDTLVRLSKRYAERGELRAAQCAMRLAEAAAQAGELAEEPAPAAERTSLGKRVAHGEVESAAMTAMGKRGAHSEPQAGDTMPMAMAN